MLNKPIKKVINALEIPELGMSGVSSVQLIENYEMIIEGCKGVLEYDENIIKVSIGKLAICVKGFDLLIKNMTFDRVNICGQIMSLEFITQE